MPNAPRPYREGIHEGVDNYGVDNCTQIWLGTQVLAAKAGRVIRADLDFHDMTRAELASNLADPNTDAALDAPRTPGLDRARRRHRHALRAPRRLAPGI